ISKAAAEAALTSIADSTKEKLEKIMFFCSSRAYRIILRSGLFDRKFYLTEYPDVFFQAIDPLVHYYKLGWKEGRKPNALFDPEEYINSLDQTLDFEQIPLIHYIENIRKVKKSN
ncbi:MAG: hypothetical protein D3924_17995, partial [Candidatus Electrothrix sp. AR4]|nr:hypothetical protein [Candidatus Electrothrix sp. AR4]